MKEKPAIRKHLLWEYDWDEIDFFRMYSIVIERVIERGDFQDWREIIRYYGKPKIRKTAEESTRLDKKNKNFTPIFLQSDFVN